MSALSELCIPLCFVFGLTDPEAVHEELDSSPVGQWPTAGER